MKGPIITIVVVLTHIIICYEPLLARKHQKMSLRKKSSRRLYNDPSCHCSCNPYYSYLEDQLRSLRDSMLPRKVRVDLFSEACDDPTVKEDTCGSSSILVNGKECSLQIRGHNVVVLNRDGTLWQSRSFDTWGSSEAITQLNDYLLGIPIHKIVLIALQDSTSEDIELAFPGLRSVGVDTTDKNMKEFRASWLLIGYKGQAQPWQYQASAPNSKGPTRIGVTIALPSEACLLT